MNKSLFSKKSLSKMFVNFILVVMIMSLTVLPVLSESLSEVDSYQITIDEKGGKYKFDNIQLTFPKYFLGKDFNPIDFNISFYAEDGIPYIQIEPSLVDFEKKVTIKVKKGKMDFYDTVTKKDITVKLSNLKYKVNHFSRYIVIDNY